MLYFTSDTHFGVDAFAILKREMRLYEDPMEYAAEQLELWNSQVNETDIIYHLGDFCNYNKQENDWHSGIRLISHVKASVILIIGNNEQKVIKNEFNGNFEEFKKYCKNLGFKEVYENLTLSIQEFKECNIKQDDARQLYLIHNPLYHKNNFINLFGHTHRAGGLYRTYGINVGTDLNHFRLYSEKDIMYLLGQKEQYWNSDAALNSFYTTEGKD